MAQLVGMSSCKLESLQVWFPVRAHARVEGSVPGQGMCERQLINVSLSHQCFSPLSPSLALSLKSTSVSLGEGTKKSHMHSSPSPLYQDNSLFLVYYFLPTACPYTHTLVLILLTWGHFFHWFLEREREREKHRLVAFHMGPDQGSYMSGLGTKPAT